jgi:hypothetical protein
MSDAYDIFEDVFLGTRVQVKIDRDRNDNPYEPTRMVWTNGEVPFKDGVYIGLTGAVVIVEGNFVAALNNVYDKWGQPFNLNHLMKPRFNNYKYAQRVKDLEAQIIATGDFE